MSTPIRYKGETAPKIIDPECSSAISAAKARPVIQIKSDSGFLAASKNISSQKVFVFLSFERIL